MSETSEQWCVFSGDPDTIVLVTDDAADAEETVELVIDGGIARRTVTCSEWEILPRCSGCGCILDSDDCCAARVEAVADGAPRVGAS